MEKNFTVIKLKKMETVQKAKKTNAAQLKAGDFLSEIQYYQVENIVRMNAMSTGVKVKNERGFSFTIDGDIIEEGAYTASQFNETVEVTRTELIEKFGQVWNTVFTVSFHKQPDAKSINEAIESTNKGRILPIAEMKKLIKEAFKGEERILTGYLVRTETGFGRSTVVDLALERGNAEYDNRLRQVDHRTLNWLIYKNVKYVVKK